MTAARSDRWTATSFCSIAIADFDCTSAAQRLMRTQADLVLYIEKRERLMRPAPRE
jgi:hypothetical protein